MTKVVILGASGSIGRNALQVIKHLSDEFKVVCLSVHNSVDFLIEQAIELHPEMIIITGSDNGNKNIAKLESEGIKLFFGKDGLIEAVSSVEFDVLVNSLVGAVGLLPTLSAIEKGKTVAIANKESLVMAGEIITSKVSQYNAKLIPIDSEHSAIFQCIVGERIEDIRRIILTGSGGPFFEREENQFFDITVEEALAHPNWKMGQKITIDSATMMNKGFEIIEAYWLFGLPLEKINLVIHPQSIVHSLVEFVDGSIKAQLGWPDMKLPIQYALTQPERRYLYSKELDFASLGKLTFFKPDYNKFPNLRLAIDSIMLGGTAPTVLNAANEEAVWSFLGKKIPFTAIPVVIEQSLSEHHVKHHPTIDDILDVDQWTRIFVRELIKERKVAIHSDSN